MKDVIIVGGGPAGLNAALYASRAGLDTLLIEKMFVGGQAATTAFVDNYIGVGTGIGGPDLVMKMESQANAFGALFTYEDVLELDLDGDIRTVKTKKNEYKAKAVILAMGATPRKLGANGEERFTGRGVSYCATCDGAFYKGKDVCVIGGGDTAAEDAIFLSNLCNKVYLIHRRDSLRASKALQDAVFLKENIEILWNTQVKEINGDNTVTSITTTGDISKNIDVNGVFVAVGTVPSSELVYGKVELNENRYIITDEKMRTNVEGVFAAGDIVEKPLRQIITAASDGAIAAYSAQEYILSNI